MSLINPTVKQILSLNLNQGRSYVRYLINHNVGLRERPRTGAETQELWHRQYHQLPCSQDTRIKRARMIETLCRKEDPVCLLGDDDEVGLELIRIGFEKVTVYDCDFNLLIRMLAKIPLELRNRIRLIQADVRHLHQLEADFAGLVVFDPPYNYQGFMNFARAAIHCAAKDGPFQLICMTVPGIFRNRSNDWQRILDFFQDNALQQKAHHEAFNLYPIARGSQWLLRLSAALLTPGALMSWKSPLHYFSDCVIWEHQARP